MVSKKYLSWYQSGERQFSKFAPLWELVWRVEIKPLCDELLRQKRFADGKTSRPVKAIEKLIHHYIYSSAQICREVATMPMPFQLIDHLKNDYRPYVCAALAYNENCYSHLYFELLKAEDLATSELVASLPNISRFDPIRFPISELKRTVLAKIAGNPNTPKDLLSKLSSSYHECVLEALATNPNATRLVFESLSLSPYGNVHWKLALNPKFPPELCDRLAVSPLWEARSCVAARKDASRSAIATLSMDANVRVRAVAAHQLESVLGQLKLTDWCAINLGVKSSRMTNMVVQAIQKHHTAGYIVVLSDFLRRVFPNTGDYLDVLEALNCEIAGNNASKAADALLGCQFVESAFRLLEKDTIKKIFMEKWSRSYFPKNKYPLKDVSLLAPYRDKLKISFKEHPPQSMKEILRVIDKTIMETKKSLTFLDNAQTNMEGILAHVEAVAKRVVEPEYIVEVPRTLREIREAGKTLRNCLRYDRHLTRYGISNGGIFLLRERNSKKLTYAAHIDSLGNISEIKGYGNKGAPENIETAMRELARKAFRRYLNEQ